MGKTTKRSRKFSSKGGVKAALSKGTITKKGRLTTKAKRRAEPKRTEAASAAATTTTTTTETTTERDDDFLSESHLKDLNVEEFFQAVAEDASKERTDDDDDDGNDDDEKTESEEPNDAEEEEEEKEKDLVASDEEGDEEGDEDLDAAEERMKSRLEKLRTEDPEFHKYLKENDQSLLEFGEDDGEEVEDDDDQSSENEPATNKTKNDDDDDDKDDSAVAVELSPARVDRMERGAFVDFSLRSLKRVVLAYRTACHLSDADADGGNALYRIDSSEMFDRVVVLALTRCHEAFRRHALLDDDEDGDDDKKNKDDTPIPPNRLTKSPKWSELSKVIKNFFKSTQHLLNEISEPKLCTFVLRCLCKYLPFLSAFDVPLLAKPLLKTLVSKWSAPFRSEDDHVARLHAFLRVRQAALVLPYPFLDDCLKSSYLAYARVARFAADDGGVATLTFMGNCLVELYGLDKDSSYQHAFVYVRQLALHLRTAVRKTDAAATSKVLCEQYVRCLELWAAVIAADDAPESGNDDDVVASTRSLAYPLVEIVVGTARLSPNVRWLPLRLRCARLLQRLAASTKTFVPTTPFLLEALELKELRAKVKHPRSTTTTTTTTTFRLESTLRLPKEDPLGTWERRDACVSEVLFLLSQETDLYRYSVAFPEFSTRVLRKLRRFLKDPDCCGRKGGGRWRAMARAGVEVCEERAAFARRARANAVDAPKDVRELEALRPASAPDMAARYFRAESARRRGPPRNNAAATKRRTTSATPNHENETDEPNPTRTKKRKVAAAKKKKPAPNEADLANTKSLVEDDVVKEGIDWSDEEE